MTGTTESSSRAPRSYAAHDHLIDGRPVFVRAIHAEDKGALQDGLHRLSAESAYLRFFSPKHDFSHAELVYLTEIDFQDHVALVAIVDEGGDRLLVGVGRYIVCEQEPAPAAEVAFAVDDAHHGLGIATVLLEHLIRIARDAGVREFRANVLTQNRKMLDVFSHSGLEQKKRQESGVVEVSLLLGEAQQT